VTGLEEWKIGRVEGWKGGRVEGWKGGRETDSIPDPPFHSSILCFSRILVVNVWIQKIT